MMVDGIPIELCDLLRAIMQYRLATVDAIMKHTGRAHGETLIGLNILRNKGLVKLGPISVTELGANFLGIEPPPPPRPSGTVLPFRKGPKND